MGFGTGKKHCVADVMVSIEKQRKGLKPKKEGILKWYGDGENKPKDSDQAKSFYDEDEKFWMDYEEDDEANAKGADRKTIKTLTIDFKRASQSSRDSRKSTNEPHNNFNVETGFDFIYECPLTREFESKDLMRVHFGNRVPNSLVQDFLNKGVLCEDPFNIDTNRSKFEGYRLYCFFGYSASQLRNRSCLFVNKDADFWEDEIKFGTEFAEKVKLARPIKARRALITPKKIYEYFGHFDKIKVVAKYAARVGLLLSPTCLTISIPDHQYALERDWKTACGEYEFTDGCGRMSTNIAKQFLEAIAKKNDGNKIIEKYEHQTHQVPSVIQFRMMGCKGILVHDPTLDNQDIQIYLRDSQKKFDWNEKTIKKSELDVNGQPQRLIGMVTRGYSRPFQYGRLNKQYVLALKALRVDDKVFERIQEEHFDRLRRCLDDRKAAFEILCGNSQMDEADKLLNLSEEDPLPKSVMTTLRRYRKPVAEMPNNPDHDQNERKEIENSAYHIPISKSRNVYGVADLSRKLKKNECFIQVTEHADHHEQLSQENSYRRFRPRMARRQIPDGTRMVVVKCPTYYPGDIRILTQKNIPELSHLTDVVVFSTEESAKRPVPHEIHESDLDGDEYFVCWDQDLVPEKEMQPMEPTKREKVTMSEEVEIKEVIREFSVNEAIMGQVNNLFMKWADAKGAHSHECQALADLFAKSVDSGKHGGKSEIPSHLHNPGEPKEELIQYVMKEKVKQQPFRSSYDNLIRYNGLNSMFRPVPNDALYFLINKNSIEDFFSMMKYSLYATKNETIISNLNEAFVENNPCFGKSVVLVAYEQNNNKMDLVGMAFLTSKWMPFEWQNSPFQFAHRGAFSAKWIFCRTFTVPDWLAISTENGFRSIDTLENGSILPQSVGNKIFSIFSKTPLEEELSYVPNSSHHIKMTEPFGKNHWPAKEKNLQTQVQRMKHNFQAQNNNNSGPNQRRTRN